MGTWRKRSEDELFVSRSMCVCVLQRRCCSAAWLVEFPIYLFLFQMIIMCLNEWQWVFVLLMFALHCNIWRLERCSEFWSAGHVGSRNTSTSSLNVFTDVQQGEGRHVA